MAQGSAMAASEPPRRGRSSGQQAGAAKRKLASSEAEPSAQEETSISAANADIEDLVKGNWGTHARTCTLYSGTSVHCRPQAQVSTWDTSGIVARFRHLNSRSCIALPP